ncbi:MAG: HAMP domain-containing protein [Chromatiaceae bacterium]|jgi:signal transduction histidine kinase|nr:HAMP domain-containing protein [Chromatiaceae bacterium]
MKLQLPRSFTFRLALTYMSLFGLSVLVLMLFIYWSTAAYMTRQSDALIESEITGLAERYDMLGLEGLMSLIKQRLSRQPTGLSIYLLTTDDHTRLLGNLNRWPTAAEDATGWINFRLGNAEGDSIAVHEARARRFALSGGFHLLVGRDISPLIAAKERIAVTLAWGLGLTLVLGVVGGWWISQRMARRIETINRTSREIIGGDLSRRMPLQGTDDELDHLANNLNQMLDRIQALMEDVRRVSDNIAHDLRTPLGRLHNQLDSLRSEMQTAGRDTTGVEKALGESEALLSTFNALLRIARIEAGYRTEGFVPVDLAALARDVAEYYEPLAEARDQSLALQVVSGVQLSGDRDLLFQALANLLDNAIKYTPPGGQIGIGLARADPDSAELVVSDNGPGVPPAARGQIFQRFFRLEASRSTPGSGMGLSLVEAVARLHGMQVVVQDNAPGTRFILRFHTLVDGTTARPPAQRP